MLELLLTVFKSLEKENIHYCMLRDADQLDQFNDGGEVDLLVKESQIPQLRKLLTRLNFISLPDRGYDPHHFFIAYDEASGGWLKLDIVGEVVYGKPVPHVKTELASNCLTHRQRLGPTFVPAPEDELITLMLHCVLDKGLFASRRRERMKVLRRQIVNERYLSTLLVTYWLPAMTWSRLAALIEAENWTTLLAQRKEIFKRLEGRDHINSKIRKAQGLIGGKISNWLNPRRPASITTAFLAPDGAGKSTLAANIQESFYFPVQTIYMGLYPKRTGGQTFLRLPGFRFAWQLSRIWLGYLSARFHLARHHLVVFDRFNYDSDLQSRPGGNGLKRFKHWLLNHPQIKPDLVVLLDAPGEILYARKGEHNPAFLEGQRQSYLKLRSRLPQMIVVDATREADGICRQVTAILWRGYLGRQAGLKAGQFIKAAASGS